MQVTVRYMAQLRQAAGRSSEALELPRDATVQILLDQLAALHGDAFARLLTASTPAAPPVLVFVAEEHAPPTRPLQEGDVITILTPMAGG